MSLTALELENFKGVATRQRVELAPLTLLFGVNSAGKSTLLQALLYLHELIEHGAADVDRTELGGAVIELGGFARLVHRHETDRAIVLRAEFETPASLERFGRDLADFPFPDLDDEIESAWLELTVRVRTTAAFRGALVERAVIGAAGEPLVWLEIGATLREAEPLYVRVNLGHPLLENGANEAAPAWQSIAVPAEGGDDRGAGGGAGDGRPLFAISRRRLSALPAPTEPLRLITPGDDTEVDERAVAQLRTLLEMVIVGTTAQIADVLRESLYVGPLRALPPRGFLYERAGRPWSWADGLAAWDLLLADRGDLVERTNAWLTRLGAGCQVVVQQLFEGGATAEEMAERHVDRTVRRLLLDTGAGSPVLPAEVGAGVSQVLPVVVAALAGRGGLTLIEQPEIHVHPAVQVALGDLFIEAATRDGPRRGLLIETHSEHLVLRLLRRIRQVTDGELPEEALPLSPADLSVVHVESTPKGVRIRRLRVNAAGEFEDRWPKGFFTERMEELL